MAHAEKLVARMDIVVNGGLTADASIELNGVTQNDALQTFFLVVPFTSFEIPARADDIVSIPAKDRANQSIVAVLIPKGTTLPISLDASIKLPPAELDKLLDILARETNSYIYRTNRGIEEQITMKLVTPRSSDYVDKIEEGHRILLSSVALNFPEGTDFVGGAQSAVQGFETSEDMPYRLIYNVEKTLGNFAIVRYKLPRATESSLIISFIIAIFGLTPVGMEHFAQRGSRWKVIVYGMVLLLAAAAALYFYFLDQPYVLENKKEFVAPGVVAVVILILFIRGLFHLRTGATAQGGTARTA